MTPTASKLLEQLDTLLNCSLQHGDLATVETAWKQLESLRLLPIGLPETQYQTLMEKGLCTAIIAKNRVWIDRLMVAGASGEWQNGMALREAILRQDHTTVDRLIEKGLLGDGTRITRSEVNDLHSHTRGNRLRELGLAHEAIIQAAKLGDAQISARLLPYLVTPLSEGVIKAAVEGRNINVLTVMAPHLPSFGDLINPFMLAVRTGFEVGAQLLWAHGEHSKSITQNDATTVLNRLAKTNQSTWIERVIPHLSFIDQVTERKAYGDALYEAAVAEQPETVLALAGVAGKVQVGQVWLRLAHEGKWAGADALGVAVPESWSQTLVDLAGDEAPLPQTRGRLRETQLANITPPSTPPPLMPRRRRA